MMYLRVEFVGTLIEHAYKEAMELANRMKCSIRFFFNGIDCVASPDGDLDKGVKSYYTALKSELKIAVD